MIITCPSCATRYDVDDDGVPEGGRSLRCAVCATSWFVPAPEPIGNLVRAKKSVRPAPSVQRQAAAKRADPSDPLNEIDDPDAVEPATQGVAAAVERAPDDEPPATEQNAKERAPNKKAETRVRKEEPLSFLDEGDEVKDKPGARPKSSAKKEAADRSFNAFGKRDDKPSAQALSFSDDAPRAERVVDAEFESIDQQNNKNADDENDDETENFDSAFRATRPRSTALTRLDQHYPTAFARAFDEELYNALSVQPRALEKAVRKARRRAEAREKNRLTPMTVVGWVIWGAVVAASTVAAVAYRDDIVTAWPKADAAYAAIGLEAQPQRLMIADVSHRLAMSTGGPALEITGLLRNDSTAILRAGLMQAEAFDEAGMLLARWTFKAETRNVEPYEVAGFATRAPAPDGVKKIVISFADRGPLSPRRTSTEKS